VVQLAAERSIWRVLAERCTLSSSSWNTADLFIMLRERGDTPWLLVAAPDPGAVAMLLLPAPAGLPVVLE
jgi:hypothetical protein